MVVDFLITYWMNTTLYTVGTVPTDTNAKRIINYQGSRNHPIFHNCTPLLETAVRTRILNSEKYWGTGSCFLNGTETDPTWNTVYDYVPVRNVSFIYQKAFAKLHFWIHDQVKNYHLVKATVYGTFYVNRGFGSATLVYDKYYHLLNWNFFS